MEIENSRGYKILSSSIKRAFIWKDARKKRFRKFSSSFELNENWRWEKRRKYLCVVVVLEQNLNLFPIFPNFLTINNFDVGFPPAIKIEIEFEIIFAKRRFP